MITLHYYPSNASFAPHVLLHELAVPFALQLVDRTRNEHQSPDYLRLNPNGQIPVLVDGDLVLYETAAICLHLADTHTDAGLAPSLGTPERAQMYKWLMWMTNTVQALLMHYYYGERLVDDGNAEGARQVKRHAQQRVVQCLKQLDHHLAAHGGPWMAGAGYSLLDPYALMLCRWTRGFDDSPARSFAHIGPYLQRMLVRPAVQRVVAAEQLVPPLV
jgi:glutathione S-transferase